MIIAIDGPSGAGKSTVSKAVARKLGFQCLDTGAMYRSIAWKGLHDGADLEDGDALGAIAENDRIEFVRGEGPSAASRVLIAGNDVTHDIRTARIDRAVSAASAHPRVRRALVEQQRRIGRSGDYVVEGRDIGTAVFPDAQVKVFLTASDDERARRRVEQNRESGVGSTDFDEVLRDLKLRDEKDASRDASPLAAAEDARVIDSSRMSIEEVIDAICAMARAAAEE